MTAGQLGAKTETDIPLTLTSLRRHYAKGTSPQAVIRQVFSTIARVEDPRIFISLFDEKDLLAEAESLGEYDPSRPLWGVPFVIKDNIDVAGHPTTAACPDFTYTPEETAFVVQRLQAAGALLIGKTNLDQFATGLVGVRTPYGAPRNAIDPEIVPGGSSAGSAVAVAHGIATFSLGSDTAGSGRVPAALNNIVGLKPTLGALSSRGLLPACRTLDTVSVFALTVSDAYDVFRTAASFDPADSYARDIEAPALVKPQTSPRIGIPSAESIRFEGDEAQRASFAEAISALENAGAEIIEIDFSPLFEIAQMLYSGCWVAERYVATQSMLTTNPDGMFPVTRKIIESAESKTAADAFRDFYQLKELSRAITPVLDQYEALCVPTIPTFPTVADLETDPVGPNNMLGTYTNFVNLMDMCGIAVPIGPRKDGRPGSVTILAKVGADAEAAALATILEASPMRSLGATGWPTEAISLPEQPAPDMFRVAVCGAHMLGLPLNHTLTQRGATFVRSHTTAANYTFHALSGSGIARPGLIRTAEGEGANIAVELWDMPSINFGSFMQTVPSPLTIGTIILSDDTTVQGFLCEPFAAVDATDITAVADWRAYLAQGE